MSDSLTGLARAVHALRGQDPPEDQVRALHARIEGYAAEHPNLDRGTLRDLLTQLARHIDPACPADIRAARAVLTGAGVITAADLRVRREALGLSQAWIAQQLGVQERAVRRWEAGDRAVPGDVAELLDRVEVETERLVEATLGGLGQMLDDLDTAPAGIDLTAYPTDEALWSVHPGFAPLPASWHRAMLAQVRSYCEDTEVRFVYAPAEPSTAHLPPR